MLSFLAGEFTESNVLTQWYLPKSIMEWDLDNCTWRFSQRHHNGTELFGTTLPNFCQDFQKYIDDGTLVPGWQGIKNFQIIGPTHHVSTANLQCLTPPGSLAKALFHRNPDRAIWLDSYNEEYDGVHTNDTFDIISEEEYICLCHLHGIKAMPSMCTFTVK
jgi:hypothetical protein